ncbi:hypothetical protein [Streptomyces sp. NPDC007117]|uniref:hypothetical protein n=1 Tax=Streptomyces sp. NPDC007117 TaxID=3154314 RepID=UPI0033CBAC77
MPIRCKAGGCASRPAREHWKAPSLTALLFDLEKWWKTADPESQKKYAAYQANPTHYLIDDNHAQQRAAQQRDDRQKALDEAKAKADREQRKKDGVWVSLMKGNFSNAWDNTKDNVSNAWGSVRDSAFGQWVGDNWRTIADVAAFAACFVSLGICALAAAVVITAKALADLKTHGLDYAGEQFSNNLLMGTVGLGAGAAAAMSWKAGVNSGRITEYLSRGRHAAGRGRHAAPGRDPFVRGTEFVVGGSAGVATCAIPSIAGPSYC